MTREEQDKRWNELSEQKQLVIKQLYEAYSERDLGAEKYFESLFGKHNLQPKLTYEDVAWKLFRKNTWIYDYEMHEIKKIKVNNQYYHFNCTSERQVNKLIAINQLLNVAKYLNKNEDGSKWVPNFSDANQKKWYLNIDYNFDKKGKIKINWKINFQSEIVYFRTEEIAQQAGEILGEELIRTALENY